MMPIDSMSGWTWARPLIGLWIMIAKIDDFDEKEFMHFIERYSYPWAYRDILSGWVVYNLKIVCWCNIKWSIYRYPLHAKRSSWKVYLWITEGRAVNDICEVPLSYINIQCAISQNQYENTYTWLKKQLTEFTMFLVWLCWKIFQQCHFIWLCKSKKLPIFYIEWVKNMDE